MTTSKYSCYIINFLHELLRLASWTACQLVRFKSRITRNCPRPTTIASNTRFVIYFRLCSVEVRLCSVKIGICSVKFSWGSVKFSWVRSGCAVGHFLLTKWQICIHLNASCYAGNACPLNSIRVEKKVLPHWCGWFSLSRSIAVQNELDSRDIISLQPVEQVY